MPVIRHLPAIKVIKGFRGILDFYCWKNLYCVRKWPRIPYANRTPASLASAVLFGAVSHGYALLGAALKTLFAEDAADHNRTGRDLYISATLGHLHEASMSDFLDLLIEATAYLQALAPLADALVSIGTDQLLARPAYDGADWQALLVDAQRHLQADILASALPANAATDANQDTIITRLNLITKLEHALESVHTDRLKVRGEDQLFTFGAVVAFPTVDVISGANGYIQTPAVPPATIWHITTIVAYNATSPTTRIDLINHHDATDTLLKRELAAFAIATPSLWSGHTLLDPTDTIRSYFKGGLVHDTCLLAITGHSFTLET